MPPGAPSSTSMRALSLSQPLPAVLLSFACFAAKSKSFLLSPRPLPSSSTVSSRRLVCRTVLPCSSSLPWRCGYSSSLATRQPSGPLASAKRHNGGVATLKSVAAPEMEKVAGLGELLHSRNGVNERFVFFGGKGGVGKTSTAAAVAVHCADAGLR